MNAERLEPDRIVEALLDAARTGNWGKVDDELVPQLSTMDGDPIAARLLNYVKDENNDIRDVVATGLTACNINDKTTLKDATTLMIGMATADLYKYAAGRAATFLLKHEEDEENNEDIKEALKTFKQRAIQENWQADLIENISALTNFF